jgi:hypothetical protein
MGDAAAAAFDRKLRRCRSEIRELRSAGIVFRPLVWTADGRPHPAATRTLKYAAEVAASRGNQLTTAASPPGRWWHQIQIAILRRRAAMYRAVLPRPSSFEHWLQTGAADRDAADAGRAPAVDDDDGVDLAGVPEDTDG